MSITPRRGDVGGQQPATWLWLAQISWIVVVVVNLVAFVVSLQPTFELFKAPCLDMQTENCPPGQAPLADWRALQAQGLSVTAWSLLMLGVIIGISLLLFGSGFIIAWRRRHDLTGLFVSATLITFGATGMSDSLTNATGVPEFLTMLQFGTVVISYPALAAFLLTFPNGKFTPGWTAIIVPLWIVQFVLFNSGAPAWVLALSILVTWGGCAVTQIYRYLRVYTVRERQQTKWVVFGLAVGIGLNIIAALVPIIWPGVNTTGSLFQLTQIVWLALFWAPLPVGVGIALLRYRLYDIDIIIKRTVTYGLVTLTLACVYVGGVFGGQQALLALTKANAHDTPPILIVLTTLVVAALFQPLRLWIQTGVDRAFYRRVYDARQTVERFSAALRSEVDLPALSAQLTAMVEDTMQPASVSLWLRDAANDARNVATQDTVSAMR
jgi:hypothetical protein